MSAFDTTKVMDELQKQTRIIRKRRFYTSQLDRYKGELLILHRSGASVAELKRWLRPKRINVSWSTVDRWLKKNG